MEFGHHLAAIRLVTELGIDDDPLVSISIAKSPRRKKEPNAMAYFYFMLLLPSLPFAVELEGNKLRKSVVFC